MLDHHKNNGTLDPVYSSSHPCNNTLPNIQIPSPPVSHLPKEEFLCLPAKSRLFRGLVIARSNERSLKCFAVFLARVLPNVLSSISDFPCSFLSLFQSVSPCLIKYSFICSPNLPLPSFPDFILIVSHFFLTCTKNQKHL